MKSLEEKRKEYMNLKNKQIVRKVVDNIDDYILRLRSSLSKNSSMLDKTVNRVLKQYEKKKQLEENDIKVIKGLKVVTNLLVIQKSISGEKIDNLNKLTNRINKLLPEEKETIDTSEMMNDLIKIINSKEK